MKKDTQKAFRDPAQKGTRKLLRLDAETLRVMNGGSQFPDVNSPGRPSQSPTLCF